MIVEILRNVGGSTSMTVEVLVCWRKTMAARLDLHPDELLSTTRAVRWRLDLTRPVERAVIEECLELAIQAPTGRNRQRWHFVVVTDPGRRAALADLFRIGLGLTTAAPVPPDQLRRATANARSWQRIATGFQYLTDHLHEVPVLVVPCITGRTDHAPVEEQARTWGSILPAVWSFMLAARSRGLGTVYTTPLSVEPQIAELLGIPHRQVMQAALIPVAYTRGTDFSPAPRAPLHEVVHWNRW